MTARTPHRALKPHVAPPSASTSAPPDTRPDPAAERLAYSVNETARLTGLSRDLLYNQMRQGNLEHTKVGRRRLITRRHLGQFLDIASGTWRFSSVDARGRTTGSDAP